MTYGTKGTLRKERDKEDSTTVAAICFGAVVAVSVVSFIVFAIRSVL